MALVIQQAQAVKQHARVCLWGTPKAGKAQPLDAKILTPTGWKLMGDIQVGDEVINSQGGTSRVTGVFPQGEKDIYRVVMNDGAFTECCDDHLWFTRTVYDRYAARKRKKAWWRMGTVKTLREIRTSLKVNGKYNHAIPLVQPIEFAESTPPTIDPYLFGVLLGDGSFQPCSIIVTSADQEIQESIRELLPVGVQLQRLRQNNDIDFAIRRTKASGSNLMLDEVRACGLGGKNSKEKFIPDRYKFASISDRIALLQGLLDTDGCTHRYTLEYATSSPQLAGDVQFLVESLGGKAYVAQRIPHYTHKEEYRAGSISYRLNITLPPDIVPFRLSRKIAAYNPRTKFAPNHTITRVEYVGKKEVQCIAVDAPDQLYVTDHCILTHNTHSALVLATAMAGEGGKVGVISSEYGSSKLLAHKFPHDIIDLAAPDEFGKVPKNPFAPERYEEALQLFLKAGYKAIVIDSLSHAWAGQGGILEFVDSFGASKTFSDGWKQGTPKYNHLLDTILSSRCHIFVTLRAKDKYNQEEYTKRDGSKGFMPKNTGEAPVMGKGFAFEMQLTLRMDSMVAYVEASGVEEYIHKGEEIEKPGPELAYRLLEALDGVELPEPTAQEVEINKSLAEFRDLYPSYCSKTLDWKVSMLRKALDVADNEQVPTPYSDDDVSRVSLYVASKKQEKANKAASGSAA